MTNVELIDLLCKIVEQQSEIIREQAFFIEEHTAIDDEIKKTFAEQRSEVDAEIDIIERSVGPIINASPQKGVENA